MHQRSICQTFDVSLLEQLEQTLCEKTLARLWILPSRLVTPASGKKNMGGTELSSEPFRNANAPATSLVRPNAFIAVRGQRRRIQDLTSDVIILAAVDPR